MLFLRKSCPKEYTYPDTAEKIWAFIDWSNEYAKKVRENHKWDIKQYYSDSRQRLTELEEKDNYSFNLAIQLIKAQYEVSAIEVSKGLRPNYCLSVRVNLQIKAEYGEEELIEDPGLAVGIIDDLDCQTPGIKPQ